MSEPFIPKHVVADNGRIAIPKSLCRAVAWLTGSEPVEAWLFLVQEGRHRLLSDEQVHHDAVLEPIRALVLTGTPGHPTEPTFAEEPSRAILAARLATISISPKSDSWRLLMPKALEVFAPDGTDLSAFSILVSLEGYLEIWYTDVLTKFGRQPVRRRPGISSSASEI
jgi:hypothetical protein